MRPSPRSRRPLLALLALASSSGAPALAADVPGSTVAEPADWTAVGSETADFLSTYLQVDTLNPPGNELEGARFLEAAFRAEGIPSSIFEVAPASQGQPARANFIARLEGSSDAPPLCLLSHIDVASAEPDRWPEGKGPLSGTLDEDGMIWGRGALDMKGMGAIEAMAMIQLQRLQVPLERDIVFVAVADEEVDNAGMKHFVEHSWEDFPCGHVLNEGGVGFEDMFFEGQDVYPISVGEKGVLWLRMVATADPGHGSTPIPGRSPEILMDAVQALDSRIARPSYDPSLLELLDNVGAHAGGPPGVILGSPALLKLFLRGRLMGNPLTRAVLTNTVNVTGYGGARQPNVVPAESWANLDIRMLPGTSADDMLAELEALVDDPRVRFEVLSNEPAAVSEWREDPVYEALVHRVTEGRPGAVAGPALSPGFTDSIYARPMGAKAYGFVPFLITEQQAATMHGDGEHVSTENLTQGVQVLYRVLVDVAADPEGSWVASTPLEPEQSMSPAGLEDLVGTALGAKGGAILQTTTGAVYYLRGWQYWPEGVEGRAVSLRGTLGEAHLLPEAEVADDGAISQGVAPGSGPQDFIEVSSWSFVERPSSGLEPAPWSLRYADGSGNLTRIWQAEPGAQIRWVYEPVTPERSSSGVYSGGEPAEGVLDEGRALALFARFDTFREHTELHAKDRAMGTGSVLIRSAERGEQAFLLQPRPVVRALEESLEELRTE